MVYEKKSRNNKKRRIPLYEIEGYLNKGSHSDFGFDERNPVDYTWVVNRNLTKTQKSYIMLYYNDKKTIEEIAKIYGVNKSTVSRTIRRGKNNLEKIFVGFVS